MNSRQRIQAAINHQPVDRLPLYESPWPDTIRLWRQQGLPADITLEDFFAFDLSGMSLDLSPRFPQQILEHQGDYYSFRDRQGYSAKKLFDKSGTIHFFDHVTTGREAWEAHKDRWHLSPDPDEPARIDAASYFEHFAPYPTWSEAQQLYRRLCKDNRYHLFYCYGPWEATWRHRGFEPLLLDLAADPDFVLDMAVTHTRLLLAVLEKCLQLGMKPDGIFLIEDLGSNRGPLFSPSTWRSLFKPLFQQIGGFLADHHIDFWLHSCGNAEALFPDFIACGIKVVNPLQVSAGLDAPQLRAKYGQKLAYFGNISAPHMAGDQQLLYEEIERKVAHALQGGFIFHSDHSLPPDISFDRYQWIVQTARRLAT